MSLMKDNCAILVQCVEIVKPDSSEKKLCVLVVEVISFLERMIGIKVPAFRNLY